MFVVDLMVRIDEHAPGREYSVQRSATTVFAASFLGQQSLVGDLMRERRVANRFVQCLKEVSIVVQLVERQIVDEFSNGHLFAAANL